MFSCKFCEISKYSLFKEYLWTAASVLLIGIEQTSNLCLNSGSLISIFISNNFIAIITHYFNAQTTQQFKAIKLNEAIQIKKGSFSKYETEKLSILTPLTP